MLKRVLSFCLSMIVLGQIGVMAQVNLEGAIAKIRAEKLDDAEVELKSYLGNKEKNEDEIFYWLGHISYLKDAYTQATDYFQKGLDARGRSGLNLAGMGLMMIKESKLTEAYDFLEKAMTYNKGKDPLVEYAVADAYLQGGPSEIGEAKKILYDMPSRDPENPAPHIALGGYYKKSGVPELAIEEFEKAKSKDATYVPAYVALAELYLDEGKKNNDAQMLADGLKNANEAVKLNAEFAPAYRVRGELYLIAKEYQRARDDLKKYVSLTDGDLKAQVRYASFLFLSENYQEAIDELVRLKKDTVTNVMLRLEGMSYNQIGELDKAEAAMNQYFERVQKEEYRLWQDYDAMGDIYRSKGNLEKADEFYQKAILKDDSRAEKFEELAEAYYKEARGHQRAAFNLRKEERAAKVKAQGHVDAANAAVAAQDVEKNKSELALMEEAMAVAKEKDAQEKEELAKAKEIFPLEAHYRKKALEMAEPVGLTHYQKLGVAQYNAEMWEEADASFKEVHKLKEDYLTPYTYRLRIANRLEDLDTTSTEWFAKAPAEDIYRVWGSKASLDDKEEEALIISAFTLARYYFSPEGVDGDYRCPDAKPYVDKIKGINPNYPPIKSLTDYCESVSWGK